MACIVRIGAISCKCVWVISCDLWLEQTNLIVSSSRCWTRRFTLFMNIKNLSVFVDDTSLKQLFLTLQLSDLIDQQVPLTLVRVYSTVSCCHDTVSTHNDTVSWRDWWHSVTHHDTLHKLLTYKQTNKRHVKRDLDLVGRGKSDI